MFKQKAYTPSSCHKNIALHYRSFSEYPLFVTFLLVSTVGEVCNISNKYWAGYKLAKC